MLAGLSFLRDWNANYMALIPEDELAWIWRQSAGD